MYSSLQSRFQFLFGSVCLILMLSHCSPSHENKDAELQTTTAPSEQAAADDSTHAMLKEGWRKGVLTIDVEINQKGQGESKGKQEMVADWLTTMKVTSEQQVLVVKDLRIFVSQIPSSEELKDVMDFEPYSLLEEEAKVTGSISHSATFSLLDPESIDLVKATKAAEASGVIERVHLGSLHPSLFGKGYEASLEIDLKMQRKYTEMLYPPKAEPVVTKEDKEVVETLAWYLHPAPNSEKLNDYPYIPEGVPAELKESIVKQKMEMLSTLQQIHADTFPVQSKMRAGMLTVATKDDLTLTYEYAGDKQLSFFPSIESLSGKSSPNQLKIKITLKANVN